MRRILLQATCLVLSLGACDAERAPPQARLSLVETLGGADTSGYARAEKARAFDFPRDHGAHPEFRNEWWYVTGNLADGAGRRVGYQLTLFRTALAPTALPRGSAWATNQAWMAHLAVTDVTGRQFHAFQRFARGAAGLAGARSTPFRAWVEDWSMESVDSLNLLPMRLQARDGDVALDLTLAEGKPAVLQGEAGLSRKGPEPGNASYYYSFTRMPTQGQVVLGADTLRVTGTSWFDREWSTSALSEGVVGWDWFALQLDGGWDLMVYALRHADGAPSPFSQGVLVDPEGGLIPLVYGTDVVVEATGTWTSPRDGTTYPSGWRVTLPGRGWTLDVTPALPDQELDLAFRYWEGAVGVSGVGAAAALSGRGYVELTGYDGRPISPHQVTGPSSR